MESKGLAFNHPAKDQEVSLENEKKIQKDFQQSDKIIGNQESSKVSEVENSNILCIQIFHSIIDTSQSYKISKYLVKEDSINEIKQLLPEVFNLVCIYGIKSEIKEYLTKAFEENLPIFPYEEGIYLYYSRSKDSGAIAFITESDDLYTHKPIKLSSRLVPLIRILTDLSCKIIACLSSDIADRWFFEESGTLNPYKPKTHGLGGISLKEIKVQESKEIPIKVNFEDPDSKPSHLSKDKL